MQLRDDGEILGLFEPLVLSENSKHYKQCAALAFELRDRAVELDRRIPAATSIAIAKLIRIIECHYSNLIETHDLSAHQIECGLNGAYIDDPHVQDLQREAQALFDTYKFIDDEGITTHPTDPQVLCDLHRRFFEEQPQTYRSVRNSAAGTVTRIQPGEFREQDVQVGRHVAISPGAVPRFLDRMHHACKTLGPIDTILASASAHHRFSWVHPFTDGNGRVARMMSDALIKRAVGMSGLWSLSRGLVLGGKRYKGHLASCDLRRRNSLDGRGTLSEEALASFTSFFLQTSIDELGLMLELMEPEALSQRISHWACHEIACGNLAEGCDYLLKGLLVTGALDRAALIEFSDLPAQTLKQCIDQLTKIGALTSDQASGEFLIAFPVQLADIWLPGLIVPKTAA
jgi:Fic family protein